MTKKALFSPIICAFIAIILLLLLPNTWLETFIPKSRVNQAAAAFSPFMLQGKYLQSRMLDDSHYLPIYGSSELSRLDAFHPSDYFQENYDGFVPFLVGRGGTQDIIHFLNFSEHTKQLKGRKMVFILSPQWFTPRGINHSYFNGNYSMLQAYDLAFNDSINPNLKKKAMQRLLDFTPVLDDQMLSTLYRAEISNNPMLKQEAAIVRPFAYLYLRLLEKKDLYYALTGSSPYGREINPSVKNKSWDQLQEMAAQEGRQQATNNNFGFINYEWVRIEKQAPSLKGYLHGASYLNSPEYYDFQLVLDLLKESGAKPLFISIPVNGKWYDYGGFTKNERYDYYTKIKKQIQSQGFQVADLSNQEYTPYFLKDSEHLGWVGWVYIDKAIKNFYDQNKNPKN